MHAAEQVWAKRAEKRGETNERHKNIGIAIDMCRSLGCTDEVIATKLVEMYKLSHKEAIVQVKARLSGNISNPALS